MVIILKGQSILLKTIAFSAFPLKRLSMEHKRSNLAAQVSTAQQKVAGAYLI